MKTIPIFFATDNGYVKFLHVAIRSLVVNASRDYKYHIHILTQGMTKENQDSFKVFNDKNFTIFINDLTAIAKDKLHLMDGKNFGGAMTYYRAFVPNMFKQYDKVLYLDVDITLNGDISELYNIDLGDNYIAGVMEFVTRNLPPFVEYVEKFTGVDSARYFNAGIILMNSKALRKVGLEEAFFKVLQSVQLDVCPDQDVLNYLCRHRTIILPDNLWNKQPLAGENTPLADIKLVHYHFTSKPWMFDDIMYEELFWEHAKHTMFYDDILEFKKNVSQEVKDTAAAKGAILAKAALKCLAGASLHEILLEKEPELVAKFNDVSSDRLAVKKKIKELEDQGIYDIDVEDDPPWEPLDHKKLDLFRKKPLSKFKTFLSYIMGYWFFEGLMKKRQVVLAEAQGYENLDGFEGGAIVTCNHIHPFDNYAVLKGLKKRFKDMGNRMYRVVREGNYSQPGMLGFIMRHCDTLPVNEREKKNLHLTIKTMKVIGTLVERGKKILIFPEQSMWWNYRKPRPLKKGAFVIAAKSNAPVIPCFISLRDTQWIGKDGLPVQEFTLNIMPVIYPDPELGTNENAEAMMAANTKAWQECYSRVFGKGESK